jgi:hypothetical protein
MLGKRYRSLAVPLPRFCFSFFRNQWPERRDLF